MSFSTFTASAPKRRKHRPIKHARPSLDSLVSNARQELAQNDWSAGTKHLLQEALKRLGSFTNDSTGVHILCLGLGSPNASVNARMQLALLLDICDALSIKPSQVSIYDPVFSEEDLEFLKRLEFDLLSEASKPETHVISTFPTILYMPHCDREVYESVLRSNWTPRGLSEVILLANRLMDYVENQPERRLQAESPHLLNLAPCLECTLLPEFKPHSTAFNNLAIQRIPLPVAQDVCTRKFAQEA